MMWSQCRCVSSTVARYGLTSRLRLELGAEPLGDDVAVLAHAGAEVEDHGLVPGRLERDARRVPAVALVAPAPSHGVEPRTP